MDLGRVLGVGGPELVEEGLRAEGVGGGQL